MLSVDITCTLCNSYV